MKKTLAVFALAICISIRPDLQAGASSGIPPWQYTGTPSTGQYWVFNAGGYWSNSSVPPGTVSSVGLAAPANFTVSGSPVTGTGTLTFAWSGLTTSGLLQATSASAVSTTLTPTGLTSINGIALGSSGNSLTFAGGSSLTDNGSGQLTVAAASGQSAKLVGGGGTGLTIATGGGATFAGTLGLAGNGANSAYGINLVSSALNGGIDLELTTTTGTNYGGIFKATGSGATTNFGIQVQAGGATTNYAIYGVGGQWNQQDSTASTSTSTGSLVNGGGFGNAGAAWIGGLLNVAGTGTFAGITSTLAAGPAATFSATQGNNLVLFNEGATNKWALYAPTTGAMAWYSTTSVSNIMVMGAANQASWLTTGAVEAWTGTTYTNTSTAASTNVASAVGHSFAAPTFAATNTGVTATNTANVYIAGAPTNGTNFVGTNTWALWVNGQTFTTSSNSEQMRLMLTSGSAGAGSYVSFGEVTTGTPTRYGFVGTGTSLGGAGASETSLYGSAVVSIRTNAGTLAAQFTGANSVFSGSITTAAGTTAAAGAWKLGALRTSTALVVSTTQGIQLDVGGTLYTLAVLSTNP